MPAQKAGMHNLSTNPKLFINLILPITVSTKKGYNFFKIFYSFEDNIAQSLINAKKIL